MTKPICYIDVDGVINAQTRRIHPPYRDVFIHRRNHAGEIVGGRPRRITVHDDVKDLVADLERAFEMRWASWWQSSCPTRYGPALGFGTDWPFVDFEAPGLAAIGSAAIGVVRYGYESPSIVDQKWPGLVHDAGDRDFVFIDDDIKPRHYTFAAALPNLCYLIKPQHSIGMTEEHVADALEFADTIAAHSSTSWSE